MLKSPFLYVSEISVIKLHVAFLWAEECITPVRCCKSEGSSWSMAVYLVLLCLLLVNVI